MSMKLPYQLRGLRKEHWLFIIGLVGGILIGCGLWISDLAKIGINSDLIRAFAWAVLTVALIIASVMVYLAEASPRMFQKRGVAPFLYPLMLLMVAVFFSVIAYFILEGIILIVGAIYFFYGASFFFYELFDIIREETLGATLRERITYESREKKEPILGEKSPTLSDGVFKNKIRINRGDAILALCDSIEEGRRLAREMIRTGKYGIYITADRPWTIIKEEFKDYKENLYCIDCFTNFYGLDEFKENERCLFSMDMDAELEENKISGSHNIPPTGLRDMFKTKGYPLSEAHISKEKDNKWAITDKRENMREISYIIKKEEGKLNVYIYTENFYPYTPRPVTIRKLHGELRDIRKRTVSKIRHNKDLSQLSRKEKKEVKEELASKEAKKEREKNVRIIYDSVSSLASIFDIEDLLKFLIHDTNVDKTIGRNTLLLIKKGILEDSVIKKLESFCEVCLNPKVINGKMLIHINKIRDEKPPADFSIDC